MPDSQKKPEAAQVNRVASYAGTGYLRLGLYDPCRPAMPPKLVGPVFTVDQMADMKQAVMRYYEKTANRKTRFCVGAFPAEFDHADPCFGSSEARP